ncbi:MAG: hypothetical protein KKC43_09810 [Alphaproteobacteria bacterium]|nr:hypothetical protein [Alphaproteobacteria bacterium]
MTNAAYTDNDPIPPFSDGDAFDLGQAFGPVSDLPFTREQAEEIRQEFNFPLAFRKHDSEFQFDMYGHLSLWHKQLINAEHLDGERATRSKRIMQLKQVSKILDRAKATLAALPPEDAFHLEERVSHLAQADMIAMDLAEIGLPSAATLTYQLDRFSRAAGDKVRSMNQNKPNRRDRQQAHPGVYDVTSTMIAAVWHQHKEKSFHGEFDPDGNEPLNECARFVVRVLKLLRPRVPNSYVASAMKEAQANINSVQRTT